MRIRLEDMVRITKGKLVFAPSTMQEIITGLTWDSRTVSLGDAYLALRGRRCDGHSFVADALGCGAKAAFVMDVPSASCVNQAHCQNAALIQVSDTREALVALARWWRSQLKGLVIALSGSSGKTTTKNLIRDVLASSCRVVATLGNENNELGVPKTLLSANSDTEAIVVEMGMRGPGELTWLCEVAAPTWGLIVNTGESHIERLGSRKAIAQAKAELLACLPDGSGQAFVNNYDSYTNYMCEVARLAKRHVETVRFAGCASPRALQEMPDPSCAGTPAVWAEDVRLDAQGHPHFTLCAKGFDATPSPQRVACSLALRGRHTVEDACAACAVGCAFGIELSRIATALAHSAPESSRQELLQTTQGATIINDAYNANPDSMRASLEMLAALSVSGRRIAILGDMAELGRWADRAHRSMGHLVATLGIDRLVCVGDKAQRIGEGALSAGMDAHAIVYASSSAQALDALSDWVEPDDAVLVKASRSMGLEDVVKGLIN